LTDELQDVQSTKFFVQLPNWKRTLVIDC